MSCQFATKLCHRQTKWRGGRGKGRGKWSSLIEPFSCISYIGSLFILNNLHPCLQCHSKYLFFTCVTHCPFDQILAVNVGVINIACNVNKPRYVQSGMVSLGENLVSNVILCPIHRAPLWICVLKYLESCGIFIACVDGVDQVVQRQLTVRIDMVQEGLVWDSTAS